MRARMACFQVRSLAALALLLCTSGLAHAGTPPVHVQVYGTHEGPNMVYHYKVINNSDIALSNIVIGSFYNNQYGFERGQLDRLPRGWALGPERELGEEILLAPDSTAQPPFWTARISGSGPGDLYLEWHLVPDGQPYAISPGQSLAGFSVFVPLFDDRLGPSEYITAGQIFDPTKPDIDPADDKYLRASFKTEYMDGKFDIHDIRGRLELADTTPPILSVTLTPSTLWPPNEKMVTIDVTINAKDDYDPNPVIRLISITANESLDHDDVKLPGGEQEDLGKIFTDIRQFQLKAEREGNNKAGRIYTVTYLAADASGNQVMTTATVTVPHDMDEHEGRERKDKQSKKEK